MPKWLSKLSSYIKKLSKNNQAKKSQVFGVRKNLKNKLQIDTYNFSPMLVLHGTFCFDICNLPTAKLIFIGIV